MSASGFRPTEMPELREELLRWVESAKSDYYFNVLLPSTGNRGCSSIGGSALRLAELFYVAPEMAELARHAAQTMPDFELAREDLPAEFGLLYSPVSLYDPAVRSDQMLEPVHGYAWGVAPGLRDDTPGGRDIVPAIGFSPITDRQQVDQVNRHTEQQRRWQRTTYPRLYELWGRGIWEFDNPLADQDATSVDTVGKAKPILTMAKAIWLLMAQPIAAVTTAELDHVTTKRLAKKGIEATVRVIALRRPKSDPSGEGLSDREYQHQWIVRGHWRQQFYPSRGVRRPIWIAPHIKGPEGAPLLGGEKVYHWKR